MANNGYRLEGHPIEYMNINQKDHYIHDAIYIATKVIEKVLIEYSQTGSVTYSNDHLQDAFRCSRRGLQIAMNKAENELGIFKRVYADSGKYHRDGFEINIDKAIELLSLTNEDVEHLNRGDLKKHFVMQKSVYIRRSSRDLKSLLRRIQNDKNKEIYQSKINELQAKNMAYDNYVNARVMKAKKSMIKNIQKRFSVEEILSAANDLYNGLGFFPPGASKN